MERRCEVRVSRGSGLEWLVWLDDLVAGRFLIMCEALDYASTLECSPRARREAVAS